MNKRRIDKADVNLAISPNESIVQAHEFPKKIDDINRMLSGLALEEDKNIIQSRLSQIAIYFRLNNNYDCETTEGDNAIAEIENRIVEFLNHYNGQNFESIYPWLIEIINLIPKFDVHDIDVSEIRDNIADYHEDRPCEDPFMKVAESIREKVHRKLSSRAIGDIDEMISFLRSNNEHASVAGSYCNATKEQKEKELSSDLFPKLIKVQKQLSLIWGVSNNTQVEAEPNLQKPQDCIIDSKLDLISNIISKYQGNFSKDENGSRFLENFEQAKAKKETTKFGHMKYNLKNYLFSKIANQSLDKGREIFDLMIIETILENIAFISYTEIVNQKYESINDANYEQALLILADIALCLRSTGQANKNLGRFARLINEDSNIIDDDVISYGLLEMQVELEKYILELKRAIASATKNLETSYINIEETNNALCNNILREKTTHIFANLLGEIHKYLEKLSGDEVDELGNNESKELKLIDIQTIQDNIFDFGLDIEIHDKDQRWLMGEKGASLIKLCEFFKKNAITADQVNIPKGFGLGTQTWSMLDNGITNIDTQISSLIEPNLCKLEKRTGKKFGDENDPLILVARSGAPISMPGILPTIGHIGLNEEIVDNWSTHLEEPKRAYNAYIRFLFNYAESVFEITPEQIFSEHNIKNNTEIQHIVEFFQDSTIEGLKLVIKSIKEIITRLNSSVPDDPYEQLLESIKAVFKNYQKEDVQKIVQTKHIPPKYQTACLIQECLPILSVDDCSGVFFTCDPLTGDKKGVIEFANQYGEDLVQGRAKPKNLEDFRQEYPDQYEVLIHIGELIEKNYTRPNDIEFGIRNNTINIFQTRRLRLTPIASVIAFYRFYLEDKLLIPNKNPKLELIRRTKKITNQSVISTYLSPIEKTKNYPIAKGEQITGGVVSGIILSDISKIDQYPNDPIVYFTKSNLPKNMQSNNRIVGYVSEEGGKTSHAALIATGVTTCLIGVNWSLDKDDNIIINNTTLKQGKDFVTLDANEGYIYEGRLTTQYSDDDDDTLNNTFKDVKTKILKIIENLNS